MSLIKRQPSDLDWPTWFGGRRFLDWPDVWGGLADEADIKVEEFTEDGQLVVRAEMPGIDPDKDVEITITDHTLHLRAERRSQTETKDKKGYRSEFRYGSFSRSMPLPSAATEDDVKAVYTDGILEVRIPIDSAEAAAKKIPVERR
jgi:HSP20 family protein